MRQPRLFAACARRRQIQERLTAEIADTLIQPLRPRGVRLHAVSKQTRHLLGEFVQAPRRQEILAALAH